jgi:flagellar hook protein FlgE
MDKQGYLVNGAGYYLKAIPIDAATGNPVGDVAQVFKLTAGYLAANPSTRIDYNANLPADPKTGLLDQSDYTTNPARSTVSGTPAQAATLTGAAYTPIDLSTTPTSTMTINGVEVTFDSSSDGDGDGFVSLSEASGVISNALTSASSDVSVSENGTSLIFTTTSTGASANIALTDLSGTEMGFGTTDQTVYGKNEIFAGSGTVTATEATTFATQSLDGGSVTLYDQQGSAVDVQIRWAKMSDSPETWNLFYESNPDASGSEARWTNAGTDFVFDSKGNLTSPASGEITIPAMEVAGKSLGDMTMDFGSSGLTQYASSQGTIDVTLFDQDGYASGSLSSIGVSEGGRITATYSNGQQIDVAEVPLYKFNADQSLKRLDGSAFAETRESGTAVQMSETNITGGALEASNTDIAEEFSKMIVTQQAYSANSKIISTADTMMQDILNIIR